ncbi:MAG: DUF255 domain-containing protein [Halobacteriota archaeon]|nr:DUF255 domain-containing protein [Halobacteriota archaeon]
MEKNEIKWLEWEKESIDTAKRLDKPILLKIGATWCHWCHVMDDTTYSDPQVIESVNSDFVPISIDNDSRPDVNERYNMGGWPTTAFLTPEGTVITGGTYIPPEDFLSISRQVTTYYKENKGKIGINNGNIPLKTAKKENIGWDIVEEILGEVIDAFDPDYAGFGRSQKFPHPDQIDLLLLHFGRSGDLASKGAAVLTLDAMINGEIWDDSKGGFYRYATQRNWGKPHFEKMLEDNSKLLLVYLDGYTLTRDDRYLTTAASIRDFLVAELFEGAFMGSVDADSKKVDQRIFTNWNGMAIKALTKLFEISGDTSALDYAIEASENVIENSCEEGKGVVHEKDSKNGKLKLLTDHIWFASALTSLFAVTGENRYLETSLDITDYALKEFKWDDKGLFFDSISREDVGIALEKRWKIEDNSLLSNLLVDNYLITGEERYLKEAESLLASISSEYKNYGLFSAPYAISIDKFERLNHLVIFGKRKDIFEMIGNLSFAFRPNATFETVDTDLNKERYDKLGLSEERGIFACKRGSCKVISTEDIPNIVKKINEGGDLFGET